MSKLHRLVMVRHGETVGNSSVRFHGSTDVELSERGRAQMRRAAAALRTEVFDLVVASPLRRSWESAWIAAGGAPIRLERDFREIHFGRWEGLSGPEIEAADPFLYREWKSRSADFEFPSGERRADFRKRVLAGLERLLASGASRALLVVHKGIVRAIAEELLGRTLEEGQPELGGSIGLARDPDGSWLLGRRSSDPPGLGPTASPPG